MVGIAPPSGRRTAVRRPFYVRGGHLDAVAPENHHTRDRMILVHLCIFSSFWCTVLYNDFSSIVFMCRFSKPLTPRTKR